MIWSTFPTLFSYCRIRLTPKYLPEKGVSVHLKVTSNIGQDVTKSPNFQ